MPPKAAVVRRTRRKGDGGTGSSCDDSEASSMKKKCFSPVKTGAVKASGATGGKGVGSAVGVSSPSGEVGVPPALQEAGAVGGKPEEHCFAVPQSVLMSDVCFSSGEEVEVVKAAAARRKRRSGSGGVVSFGSASSCIDKTKALTSQLLSILMDEHKVVGTLPREVLEVAGEYERLVMNLVGENERLRGRLDVLSRGGSAAVGSVVSPAGPTAVPGPMVSASIERPIKPVETWAATVKAKDGNISAKEVVKKVVSEVGPSLGVRVHEVKALRGGGAIIRTPSVAERAKIVGNERFDEVGLSVSVVDRLGPKVVVVGVESVITPEEFMSELFTHNFKGRMTQEEFSKGVRFAGGAWKAEQDKTTNVVLEGVSRITDSLLSVGRCYIKWFSFRVRPLDVVPCCYRCLGFDHRVRECRLRRDVCRRCGCEGHRSDTCTNALNCRNCAFRGKPSGHRMMSEACPVYCAMVARANARH